MELICKNNCIQKNYSHFPDHSQDVNHDIQFVLALLALAAPNTGRLMAAGGTNAEENRRSDNNVEEKGERDDCLYAILGNA